MESSYQHIRAFRSVELPNDVWLSVIERLVTMSDLKALCLTSKSLRVLATPYLYDTILVPLWDTPKMEAFYRSVGCGAGVHLRNTRTLVFEDEQPPEEAFPNPYNLPAANRYMLPIDIEKNHSMETILHFFARSEQLTTHRFLGSRPQPDAIIGKLWKHHPRMTTLQTTTNNGLVLAILLKERPTLRTLDILFYDPLSLYLLGAISSLKDTLESLSIGCERTRYSSETFTATMIEALETSETLTNVTSLTLRYFDLSIMYQPLRNLVRLPELSRLSLLDCRGWFAFSADMANDLNIKSLKLKHFALQVSDRIEGPIEEHDAKGVELLLVILCSSTLESLHLAWNHRRFAPAFSITPTAPNLLSYSNHASLRYMHTREENIAEQLEWELLKFDDLLMHCPKLQSFGFKLPGLQFLRKYEDKNCGIRLDDKFMDVLQRAPDLRILHLRQSNHALHSDEEDEGMNSLAYAFHTQNWANAFFAYLDARGWCPKLNALVIRCHVLNDDDSPFHYIPQSCYVRGLQTDAFGRSRVVAVPVTRAILRATEPCADILDYDPDCDWANGRFVALDEDSEVEDSEEEDSEIDED